MDTDGIVMVIKTLGLNWYWLIAAALFAKAVVKVWLELKLPDEFTSFISYLSAFIVLALQFQPWTLGTPGWASAVVATAIAGTLEVSWYNVLHKSSGSDTTGTTKDSA
jgi:hypothetical protein